MDYLFDINLQSASFKISNDIYYVSFQALIKVDNSHAIKVLLAKTSKGNNYLATDNYCLLQADCKGEISPLFIGHLEQIVKSLKSIKLPPLLQSIFSSIPEQLIVPPNDDVQCIKVTYNLWILVQRKPIAIPNIKIDLYFLRDQSICAEDFVFYALDGINTHIRAEIKVEKITSIKKWHALAGIFININGESEGLYYPERISYTDSCMIIDCQPLLNNPLESEIIGGLKFSNLDIYEIIDFMISSAGLVYKVTYPKGYINANRWVTIVSPVENLKLEKDFGFGCTQFLSLDNDEIKRVIEYDDVFARFSTFALIHVNATTLYQAYMRGKRQIDQSLDFLISLVKDDSLFINHSISNTFLSKDFDILNTRVSIPPYVYIEIPIDNKRLSFSIDEADTKKPIKISLDMIAALEESAKAELLLINTSGETDKDITPLFNSLKWIRKSWDSNDIEDKIINSIIALEFIVSREENVPFMGKSMRKLIKKSIESIIRDHEVDIAGCKIDKYIISINEKFDRAYTETPFMRKLKNLIDRLNIPISEDEFKLIEQARELRNSIIHGRNIEQISMEQMQLICEIISLIAFYKIMSISQMKEE